MVLFWGPADLLFFPVPVAGPPEAGSGCLADDRLQWQRPDFRRPRVSPPQTQGGSRAVTSARVEEGQVKAGPVPSPPAEVLWADGSDRLAGSSSLQRIWGVAKAAFYFGTP